MSWVKGQLEGVVGENSSIQATFTDMEVVAGPRPQSHEEFGANPEALRILDGRKVPAGTRFQTPARLGAGVAAVCPNTLEALEWTRAAWMSKLRKKFGGFGPQGLLCLIRDIGAGGTWLCADVCAGVPVIPDILGGAFAEIVELGLYRKGWGWGKFTLPESARSFQELVMNEQKREWADLHPDLPPSGNIANIAVDLLLLVGRDTINDNSCVLSAEPEASSVEVIVPVQISLPGSGWLIRDTEHVREEESGNVKFPLDRRPAVICPRAGGKSPLMFQFGREGLDVNAPVIPLSSEALEHCVNRKVESVLRALGWLVPSDY